MNRTTYPDGMFETGSGASTRPSGGNRRTLTSGRARTTRRQPNGFGSTCSWTATSSAPTRDVSTRLSAKIEKLGPFRLLTRGDELPVFAFTTADCVDNFTVFDVSNSLRERGWLLPAYTFPANRTDLAALRIVVRQGFSHDLADLLIRDLKRQLEVLDKQPAPVHDENTAGGFHH